MPTIVEESFVVGSRHVIRGTFLDVDDDGTRNPVDLTGGSMEIKASINDGTTKTWSATIEPDQVADKGKFFYELATSDVDAAGKIELQAWFTSSGKPRKSRIVTRTVEESL